MILVGLRRLGAGPGARRLPADAAGQHRGDGGKRDSVSIEARQALDAAQQQLNSADLTGDPNPDKKLTELALGFANRSGGSDQYDVIIISGGQTITAGDVSPASIPDDPAGPGGRPATTC